MLVILTIGIVLMLTALTWLLFWRRGRAGSSSMVDSSSGDLLYRVDIPAGMSRDPFVMQVVIVLRVLLLANRPANAAAFSAAIINLADIDDRFRKQLQRTAGADATLVRNRETALDALIERSSLILTWHMVNDNS